MTSSRLKERDRSREVASSESWHSGVGDEMYSMWTESQQQHEVARHYGGRLWR